MVNQRVCKNCMSVVVALVSLLFFASSAFPWGSATHAYIDGNLGSKTPLKNLNEIYGGMAPDIFNFYPQTAQGGNDYYDLYIQTHYNALGLWAKAKAPLVSPLGKAAAFGFASHANGQLGSTSFYGADYTAHGPGGNDAGYYVIDKAMTLWTYLEPQLQASGIYLEYPVGVTVSHSIVEFAIDVMVAYRIPEGKGVGKKMIEATLLRTPEFPHLLVKAYGGSPGIDAIIVSAEREFRKTMLIYGQALNQGTEAEAISAVAELLAELAYSIYGIPVPSAFVASALVGAEELCADDYRAEIKDTITAVKAKLASAGVRD
ncbi:hypothetical protein GMSM_27700 [Geomonas sp. Red276]